MQRERYIVTTAIEDELLQLGTATLYEASGLDCALDPAIRPAFVGASLCGRALPVLTAPGDNLALHAVVEQARPGEVLVVDAGGLARGYWGEVLTVAAQHAGLLGLVIDGGVRDTEQLCARCFPTFARAICIRGTTKHWTGVLGEPMVVAGAPVRRGDTVVADADGVVVIPAGKLQDTLEHARARMRKEEDYLHRLEHGERTMDLYGFRR